MRRAGVLEKEARDGEEAGAKNEGGADPGQQEGKQGGDAMRLATMAGRGGAG